MSEIPKAYEPQSVEDKWYDFWLKQGCFTADPKSSKPAYSIVIPPPNVTGMLHMGHVLNNMIQDILSRKARMDGKEVLWLPGTDHAGIATQVMVEKQLKKEEKKSRHDLGREEFLKRVWVWKEKHGDIIVKPLFGNGGAGVFHIKPDDSNLNALIEMFTERSREPVMVQRYLPAVRQGDKRIILVDGVAMGAINRVPAAGEARSNMHVGGRPEPTRLTDREHEICARIGPALRERGLIFVGIDVIGGCLTEINVTSPTGLQEIARFDGTHLEKVIWEAIEAKR